jgi:hypothetical protein
VGFGVDEVIAQRTVVDGGVCSAVPVRVIAGIDELPVLWRAARPSGTSRWGRENNRDDFY